MESAADTALRLGPSVPAGLAEAGTSAPGTTAPRRSALEGYLSLAVRIAFTDALSIVLALFVAHLWRFGMSDMGIGYGVVMLLATPIWWSVFHAFRLYTPQLFSGVEEFRRIFAATSMGIVFIVMASYWSKASFSRLWLGAAWVLAIVLQLSTRYLWRRYVTRKRAHGELALRTLIVGTNAEAGKLADTLGSDPALGFEPIGYVLSSRRQVSANGIPVLAPINGLAEAIADYDAECLFVASSGVSENDMLTVAQAARQAGIEVKVSANISQILTSRVSVQSFGDVMALSMRPVRLSGVQAFTKRTFDLMVSSLALLVFGPVMLAIAAAIQLTSRGPAMFRQERVTKGGKRFKVYKFRTMATDGDRILREKGIDPCVPFFKLGEDDPRITKLGRFLRKTSLDELPQLLNVVKGEMSLVGPRPLPSDQVEANPEMLGPRLEVQAGLTGWWQINGRSDVAPEEAVQMDTFYIENWSLAFDLFVLLKTAAVLVHRNGAH